MSLRVDPAILDEIKEYGDIKIEDCFNCGNCTAICPLSTDETPFPRNNIRLLQLGLKERMLESVDPWLCYYCGECSETCPRQAEPAESQMALRRWLTGQYDWTGLAAKFYTSKFWELGSILSVGLFIVLMFVFFHGPVVTDQVELNTFAPVELVHIGDWIMAALLSFFLLSNVFRMHQFIMQPKKNGWAPLSIYISEAWKLVYHAATQKRYSECEQKRPWINHILLVSGYVLMFGIIVLFLPWFQTDNIYPLYHPQRWLGYYATIVLLYGSATILWGRMKKIYQHHRFSHLSDWIFPILLFFTTVTGILTHVFRYAGWPLATYYIYIIHLAILTPMLVLEVPFGKWAHLAYRPVAIYLQAVKERVASQSAVPDLAATAAD
jgi:quinone-modifying oxidoreductase subunit QmoC